jgi:sulfur carrier protein ThiS
MQIKLKLFATLTDYLPSSAVKNELPLTIDERTTIEHLIAQFNLPRSLVHLVLVNGFYIPPQERALRTFREGDVLAIWPPIAGG